MRILDRPIFVTEQYRKGLGDTVSEIVGALGEITGTEKLAFSACGAGGFLVGLRRAKVAEVVLCGIEAHVCVLQTCLDLLEAGFSVFVVADAISSRTAQNRELAIQRMRDAGAVVTSVETVLFELLERAGTEEFKQVLALVK